MKYEIIKNCTAGQRRIKRVRESEKEGETE